MLMMEAFNQSLWSIRDTNKFLIFLQRFTHHQSLFPYFQNVSFLIGSNQLACIYLGVHNRRDLQAFNASPQWRYLCVVDQS